MPVHKFERDGICAHEAKEKKCPKNETLSNNYETRKNFVKNHYSLKFCIVHMTGLNKIPKSTYIQKNIIEEV